MTFVPHVAFKTEPASKYSQSEPPGREIGDKLQSEIQNLEVANLSLDEWRDCGWRIEFTLNEKSFELYFVQWHSQDWLLAIASLDQPGVLARVLGKKRIPVRAELEQLCTRVHSVLSNQLNAESIAWRVNGHPKRGKSFDDPALLSWSHAL